MCLQSFKRTMVMEAFRKRVDSLAKVDEEMEKGECSSFCMRNLDHKYRKLMKKGISPLDEMKNDFPNEFPRLSNKMIYEIDDFFSKNIEEGIKLLNEIVNSKTPSLNNLSGKFIVQYLVSCLPDSLSFLCMLIINAGFSFISLFISKNVDLNRIMDECQDISNLEYISMIIFIIGQYSNLIDISNYLLTCENLINYNINVVNKNVLMGLRNVQSRNNVIDFYNLINKKFDNFLDEDLFSIVLNIFANSIVDYENDNLIPHFEKVKNMFVSLLNSDNEDLIESVCDFAESVIFIDEWNVFLRGEPLPIFLDLIQFYSFKIKEHAIMVIVELLKSSNDEQILSLFSKNITEVISDFLEVSNSGSTFEILQAIFTVLKSFEQDSELYEKVLLEFSCFENVISNLTVDSNIVVSDMAKNIMNCFNECKLM